MIYLSSHLNKNYVMNNDEALVKHQYINYCI